MPGLYLSLSYDGIPIRFGGQQGAKIDLWGLGFGFRGYIREWLAVFCEAGYYEPRFSEDERWQDLGKSNLGEGLMIYLNQRLAPPYKPVMWQTYSLHYSGGIGGRVGFDVIYPVNDWFSVGLMSSYRYLRLEEMVKGKDWGRQPGWWEYKTDRNFGGWQIGVEIMVSF